MDKWYMKLGFPFSQIENYLVPDTWNTQTTIQAIYSGSSELHSLKSLKQELTVVLPKAVLTFEDITATPGETIEISIHITCNQNPLSTGKIIVKVNGKTIKDSNDRVIFATVTNGIATLSYTIPESMKAKDYTLTAIYTSTSYGRIEASKTLTVTA